MARAKPWLKMWVESLDDPKMLRLTMAEEAVWWRLLRLAQRCCADGSLITSSGSPLTTSEIATCLHITSPDDIAAFNSMLKKMEVEGSLCWNDQTLFVIHFAERQEMVPSETPEAVRNRVRAYRERHRVTEKPLQPPVGQEKVPPEPPPKRNKEEEEEDTEQSRYVTAEKALQQAQGNEKSVTPSEHKCSDKAVELATLLRDLILRNNPKAKTPQDISKWAVDIDRMMNIDRRTPEEIQVIIDFCQNDGFWRSNILSASKLREKFDQLYLKEKGGSYDTGPTTGKTGRPAQTHQRPSARGHTDEEYRTSPELWSRKHESGDGDV